MGAGPRDSVWRGDGGLLGLSLDETDASSVSARLEALYPAHAMRVPVDQPRRSWCRHLPVRSLSSLQQELNLYRLKRKDDSFTLRSIEYAGGQ